MTALIGHDDAINQVTTAFASRRMHHAWLLAGIEGIGKMTLAMHIAHQVLANGNPTPQDKTAKLIAAEAHPDMMILRRAVDEKTGEPRKMIVVDDARKVEGFLRKTATHGGWRVVVVDEAHTLNRNAQNAILKILEEPPARVLIAMTVTTPGALLPTIRSRCRVVTLSPLTDAQIKTILLRAEPSLSPDDLEKLVELSGGSAGFALKILRTGALNLYDELQDILRTPTPDIARVHKLADQMGRKADAENFETVTALINEQLRQTIKAEAIAGGSRARIDHRMQQWDKVRGIFALADSANLDRKLAFIQAVGDMRA
jgi:DNA polymerase-3 subunit delta'